MSDQYGHDYEHCAFRLKLDQVEQQLAEARVLIEFFHKGAAPHDPKCPACVFLAAPAPAAAHSPTPEPLPLGHPFQVGERLDCNRVTPKPDGKGGAKMEICWQPPEAHGTQYQGFEQVACEHGTLHWVQK